MMNNIKTRFCVFGDTIAIVNALKADIRMQGPNFYIHNDIFRQQARLAHISYWALLYQKDPNANSGCHSFVDSLKWWKNDRLQHRRYHSGHEKCRYRSKTIEIKEKL